MKNSAAIGYMIIAAKRFIGLDEETIKKLERAMTKAMDLYSEEEAEDEYQNF